MEARARGLCQAVVQSACKPLGLVFLLAVTAICSMLFTTLHLHDSSQSMVKRRGKAKVHVCFCTDDMDLRAVAVAIRSAFSSAAEPRRLVFHIVTSPDLGPLFSDLLRSHLPGVRLEVHHRAEVQERLEAFAAAAGVASAGAQDAPPTPMSFAPLFLHEFLQERSDGKRFSAHRVIYLDTDTVVLGDVAELHDLDLQGRPCAALARCAQRWGDAINYSAVVGIGAKPLDPQACMVDRGALVIDLGRWRRLNFTASVEEWLRLRHAVGQPPRPGDVPQLTWMSAAGGKYLALRADWACGGLGQETMGLAESAALREIGFDRQGLQHLRGTFGPEGQIRPSVAGCTRTAKLLHFDGPAKPWLLADEGVVGPPNAAPGTALSAAPAWPPGAAPSSTGPPPPACALPESFPAEAWDWSALLRMFCGRGTPFVSCADIWSAFITPEAACELKDFDKEWRADEAAWLAARSRDLEPDRES